MRHVQLRANIGVMSILIIVHSELLATNLEGIEYYFVD